MWPLTLVTVRCTVTVPGIVGTSTDGRFRPTASVGDADMAAKRSAVSSNDSEASPALVRSMRPPPMSNGSAGVVRSSLTTLVVAVVSSAVLMAAGVQSGWSAFSRRAEPATCGDDIEVPAMAWK